MFPEDTRRYKTIFWASLAVLAVFRFWINGKILLTGDEAYHWEWSRNLAWGYYDHPPMVAYLMRAFTILGGHTLRAVRTGAVLFSTLSVIIVYLLAKQISGKEETGLLAGFLTLALPIFNIGATITTTDTPHAFFWLLSIYCFYQALFTPKRAWWYAGGVALGMAFMSKFFAFVIPASLLAFLILAPEQRHWLKKKEPYLAMTIAFTIFAPFICWNATHNWATFGFNLATRHKAPELTLKYFGEFLGGQSVALFPTILILFVYGLYICIKRGFPDFIRDKFKRGVAPSRKEQEQYLFLFCMTAPLWLVFAGISLFQRVGLHWPISTYFVGLVIIALVYQQSPRWYYKLLKIGLIGSIVMNLAIYTLALNPRIIPWNISYPGRPDKIKTIKLRELYGWEELGQRVRKSFNEFSKEGPAFIFTGSYALSSQVAFYTPGNPMVNMLGTGSVHGRNYEFWQDLELLKGQNAIQVSKDGKHPEDYFKYFERVEEEQPLEIRVDGDLIRTFRVIRCYNYLGG